MRYQIVQVGNTGLYVVIDVDTGLRILIFGKPMRPVAKESAELLAQYCNEHQE